MVACGDPITDANPTVTVSLRGITDSRVAVSETGGDSSANHEVREILDLYRRVYEELLTVPIIPGIKSEKKFAGGLYASTVEGFIPTTGCGIQIQAATSYCLDQNFLRPEMFNIVVEEPDDLQGTSPNGGKLFVWQTATTRVLLSHHASRASKQSLSPAVSPCILISRSYTTAVLRKAGIRAKAYVRDGYTPGYKFNDWEQKGVPLCLELSPVDIQKKQTLSVRRDPGVQAPIALAELETAIPALLETILQEMFERAKALVLYMSRLRVATKWDDVILTLDSKCVAVLPW